MTPGKNTSAMPLAAAILLLSAAFAPHAFAQGSGIKSFAEVPSSASQRSIQVDKVDPGDVNIEAAFRIAIYENLLEELAKTKQFKQVFRDGDHQASGSSGLLILKTTVQHYTPGSETRRAVTTVSGATKLNVKTQLVTPSGKVVAEQVVNGNVRFFGGNLRATHNLARNIANAIKQSTIPPADNQ